MNTMDAAAELAKKDPSAFTDVAAYAIAFPLVLIVYKLIDILIPNPTRTALESIREDVAAIRAGHDIVSDKVHSLQDQLAEIRVSIEDVGELLTEFREYRTDFYKAVALVKELHVWHDVSDEDGAKRWIISQSLRELFKRIDANQETERQLLETLIQRLDQYDRTINELREAIAS